MGKALSIVIVIVAAVVSISAQGKREGIRFADDKGAPLKLDTTKTEAYFPGTSYSYPVENFKPGVVQVGPRTTYLKEGLRTDEVIRLLGNLSSISEPTENDVIITIYQFERGEGRTLIAEFVGGALVRSWLETPREHPAQADH